MNVIAVCTWFNYDIFGFLGYRIWEFIKGCESLIIYKKNPRDCRQHKETKGPNW